MHLYYVMQTFAETFSEKYVSEPAKKEYNMFFLRYSFLALRYGMRTMFIKLNSFIIKIDH